MASCRRFRDEAKRATALVLALGLSVALVLPSNSFAQNPPTKRMVQHNRSSAFIAQASQRFRIPAAWIRAVMRVESGNNMRAVSPKGAMGLMQIMPETWEEMRFRYRLGKDPFDPRANVMAGTAYLRELYDRYGSPGFLAAYNAGPQRYENFILKKRRLPVETRTYVAALLPIVGGGELANPNIVTAAHLQVDTQSSLFVSRENRTMTDQAQSQNRADIAAVPTSLRDISGIVPVSDGLFVARINYEGQ